MTKVTRSVIKLLARHSDWRAEEVDAALRSEVYAGATRWHWLLRLLLPALGLGFLASGILFFFAYNWADIPKFGKLSLAGLAVTLPAILALVPRLSDPTRKYLVTTAAFLVGPFFGVFGQIYQTGANAYDLFFAWVVFIVVWVIAVDFAPLWLLFVALLNVTLSLYAEQVAGDWSFGAAMMLHFGLNALATVAVLARSYFDPGKAYPKWLPKVLALAAAGCATVACATALFVGYPGENPLVCLPPTLLVYGITASYAFSTRQLYYLVLMAFSVIAIVTALIIGDNGDTGSFFLATFWVMLAVSGSIYSINNLRKKWHHDG
jgi:uncharacterized membrane protein